jgi:hypothetical protein
MAIVYENGHWRSVQTAEETRTGLEKDLANLTPGELEAVKEILGSITDPGTSRGGTALFKEIGNLELKRTPVGIRQFVEDEYYLGYTCDTLYPKLLEDLERLFDGNYREVILTGSIGYGKTFIASIGICYLLYQLSCMQDPHHSFGIAKNSNITIACVSISEALAVKVAYENIATKIEASAYFREHYPFEKTKKELRFPGKVWVAARASSDSSVLGLNIISGILDEVNFMRRAGGKRVDPRFEVRDHAEVLYNAMQRRMKSRFDRKGKLPGVLFVISSKQTQDDFTTRRIKEALTDPTVFVLDYPLWSVKPEAYCSGDWFNVVVGNEATPSRILKDDEDPEEIKKALPEDCVLMEVPEDFRKDFENDLEGAICDLGGVSTVAISPFIQRREKILEAIDTSREHPFTSLVYDPSSTGNFKWGQMVQVYGDTDLDGMLRNQPILNRTAPRHVHIDTSLTNDSTGFCLGHISGWANVTRKDEDGRQYAERAPIIMVDVILKIVPPIGGEIVLGDVRRLVYQLSRHGYTITCVSLDRYQSIDGIQKLNQRGYNAMVVSVDTSLEPYKRLKDALYENRVNYYEYPPLIKELQQLQLDKVRRKVDHPYPNGSKDCSDALAGVVYTLTESSVNLPLPMMPSVAVDPEDAWLVEHQHREYAEIAGYGGEEEAVGMLPPFVCDSIDDDWN